MFSALGNIFSSQPVPRQTEHGDARMALHRKEDDQKGRKNKKDAALDYSDDDTTVSIESLALFLDNFLSSVTEKPKKSFDTAVHGTEEPEEKLQNKIPNNPATPNAMAAQAYQHTAIHAGEAKETPAEVRAETHIGETLSAADIRTIHKIRDDLKTLESQGVHYLHIERGESFLSSIQSATQKALSSA